MNENQHKNAKDFNEHIAKYGYTTLAYSEFVEVTPERGKSYIGKYPFELAKIYGMRVSMVTTKRTKPCAVFIEQAAEEVNQ